MTTNPTASLGDYDTYKPGQGEHPTYRAGVTPVTIHLRNGDPIVGAMTNRPRLPTQYEVDRAPALRKEAWSRHERVEAFEFRLDGEWRSVQLADVARFEVTA